MGREKEGVEGREGGGGKLDMSVCRRRSTPLQGRYKLLRGHFTQEMLKADETTDRQPGLLLCSAAFATDQRRRTDQSP